MPRLVSLDWPDHGRPDDPAPLSLVELRVRLAAFRGRLAGRGLAAAAVYGDREHAANLHWLTGFDPRFEEALLVVTATDAHLLVGNECVPYAEATPLVAAGEVAVHLVPSLSLPSQPCGGLTVADAIRRVLPAGAAVGVVGWKWFEGGEMGEDDADAFAMPAFLLDPLRRRAGAVADATPLLMHPADGLRTVVDAAEVARMEFANWTAGGAVRRMAFALREGMTDWEAVEAARLGGLPLSAHVTFAANGRPGLASPAGERLRRGEMLSFNVAHWGANVCRAGWVTEGEDDLPDAARGTLDAFVFPYAEAMSDWCGLMRPGVMGGQVWEHTMNRLAPDLFGVSLNPGHLIGPDEWMSSPIARDSKVPLRSGMAMQMDVIPSHPVHGTTRLEDGYVLADDALRADLRARFPATLARCEARAAFMRDRLGFDVPPTLLPLGDTCGVLAPFLLAPFLLAPGRVVALLAAWPRSRARRLASIRPRP